MDLGKALTFINLSIAVLLVAGLGGVYWFAYRPLPKTSGRITAPISAQAVVERDALGVHIFPRVSGRTQSSCKATSPRRIVYGRWMRFGGWPRANCPKYWEHPRWN
jgi:hypothetical protein